MRRASAFALMTALLLAGCGSHGGGQSDEQVDQVPAIATPVPATTADPSVTAELRSFAGRDTNHDGYISAAENAAAAEKIFHAIDADGDGTLTAEEFDAARAALGLAMLPSSEELIAKADQDGDGKLTLAEWIAQEGDDFNLADTNHDGKLSPAEWNARPRIGGAIRQPPQPSEAASEAASDAPSAAARPAKKHPAKK